MYTSVDIERTEVSPDVFANLSRARAEIICVPHSAHQWPQPPPSLIKQNPSSNLPSSAMSATQRLNEELVRKAREQMRTATDPLERLRLTCLARGASGIKGLARQFRIIDDDGNRRLDRREFHKGCRDFGADLSDKEIDLIFDRIDADKSGCLNFDEFLVALRPPMSQFRRDLVQLAFNKLDKNKDGDITVEDLKGVYCCRFHPKYQNGEWSEDQVFKEFLKTFEAPETTDGIVTKEEFLSYYSGVSASIDSDAYFGLMMRTAYRL